MWISKDRQRALLLACCLGLQHAMAESVEIFPAVLPSENEESGEQSVIRIKTQQHLFQFPEIPGWRWSNNLFGYDAAGATPEMGTAVIGFKIETLLDSKRNPITTMSGALAILKERWTANTATGNFTIDQWTGTENDAQVIVRFQQTEPIGVLHGFHRYCFLDSQLVTLGYLADSKWLPETEALFVRFAGCLTEVK